jgi:hypothetical protein
MTKDRQSRSPAIKTFIDFAKGKLEMADEFADALAMVCYLVCIASETSREGAEVCELEGAASVCQTLIEQGDALCRQWGIIALAILWSANTSSESQRDATQYDNMYKLLQTTAMDDVPVVRASALFAIYKIFGTLRRRESPSGGGFKILELTGYIAKSIRHDGSQMNRKMFLEICRLTLKAWSGLCEVIGWLYATEASFTHDDDAEAEYTERCHLLCVLQSLISETSQDRSTAEARMIHMRDIYIALTQFSADPDPVVKRTATEILVVISDRLLGSRLVDLLPECAERIRGRGRIAFSPLAPHRRPSAGLADLKNMLGLSADASVNDTSMEAAGMPTGFSTLTAAINEMIAQTSEEEDDQFWQCEDLGSSEVTAGPDFNQGFSQHTLPALSDWLKICGRYFHRPRLVSDKGSEMSSTRNFNIREQSSEDSAIVMAGDLQKPFSHQWYSLTCEEDIQIVTFHSYEPLVAIAVDAYHVEIWQTSEKRRVTRFSLGSQYRSSIKSMSFLNEQQEIDQFTLLVVLGDGLVKVYHGESGGVGGADRFCSTAAFRSIQPNRRQNDIITAWCQGRQELAIASNSSGYIQIYDAQQQRCTRSIPISRANLEAEVTCLDVEQTRGNMFLGGDTAGCLTMYDQRQKRRTAVKCWEDGSGSPLVLCQAGTGLEQEIVSVA